MGKNKQYISDIITSEDILSWNLNEIVFIESPTGSGKSHLIKHKLAELVYPKKILILVNRTIIKEQFENELLDNQDIKEEDIDDIVIEDNNITITTYQNIANKIQHKEPLKLIKLI